MQTIDETREHCRFDGRDNEKVWCKAKIMEMTKGGL